MNGIQVGHTFSASPVILMALKNRAIALRECFVYYQLSLGNKIGFECAFDSNAQRQQSIGSTKN